MKLIDLRHGLIPNDYWYFDYLAYLASTPRNVIECHLEPQTPHDGHQLRVIDLWKPDQLVVDGYPTQGIPVWWTIIVLAGAPERMAYHLGLQRSDLAAARKAVAVAEARFREIVIQKVNAMEVQPEVFVLGSWRDGELMGFLHKERALELARRVALRCEEINSSEQLSWEHRFQPRVGIGRSVGAAFCSLIGAHHNQARCETASINKGQRTGLIATIDLLAS